MDAPTRALAVGTLIVLLFHSPVIAHARFGTAGHSGGGSRSGGGGRSSGTGGSSGGSGHSSGGHTSRNGWGSSSGAYGAFGVGPRYGGWGYGFFAPSPPFVVITPPAETDVGLQPSSPPSILSTLDVDVTLAQGGRLLGARVLTEGRRMGASIGYTGVFSPATDGSDGLDVFHLAQVRLTYALLSGERGRLRAELGAHFVSAPDITFLAPGAGLSGALGLGAGFGLEARLFGNFWPYTQIDASCGLLWATHTVAVLAGVRALYLNDNGALGDANAGETSDLFCGPYAGLAFAI